MPKLNHSEILEKAIQKAIDGGWETWPHFVIDGNHVEWQGNTTIIDQDFYTVIFNHDFAKSLFGEEHIDAGTIGTFDLVPAWQHHLQQMVIADDPIEYLGANI